MKGNAVRKPHHKPASGRRSRGNTLLGIFLGLVLGVLMSLGVVWYMNKMPLPFRDKAPRAEPDRQWRRGPQWRAEGAAGQAR